jgi:transposase
MTASAVCRPLPSCRGHELPGSQILNCVLDGEAYVMGYLGLVPSEYSTGQQHHRGDITKTGNAHARRVLVEAAWNYRFPARLSYTITRRQEGQSKFVRDIAWKAQLRLGHRYRKLQSRKLHQNKVVVAIARELSGFLWDIARHVTISA